VSAITLPCAHCGDDLAGAPACEVRSFPCGALCDQCVDPHILACELCRGFFAALSPDAPYHCIRCAEHMDEGDAFSVLPCGPCCDWCIESHCDACGECRAHCDADPFHAPESDDDALPGMASAVDAQADAAAEYAGAALSDKLRAPLADVSRIAGAMESHTPLFRGSDADPQLSLF
jgi:hypothetical protein